MGLYWGRSHLTAQVSPMPNLEIYVRPFTAQDQIPVRALILAGLEEHWGQLDPRFNQDLEDIAKNYAAGHFLVAWAGQERVGCGALLPEGPGVGRIVRMSVASSWRRQGIAARILEALLAEARRRGWRRIVLETTETWADAVGFYQRQGFITTHFADGDRHFQLDLD